MDGKAVLTKEFGEASNLNGFKRGKIMPSVAMTPEQIKNFRQVLVGVLGPYALMMPDADVVALRDKMNKDVAGKSSVK